MMEIMKLPLHIDRIELVDDGLGKMEPAIAAPKLIIVMNNSLFQDQPLSIEGDQSGRVWFR